MGFQKLNCLVNGSLSEAQLLLSYNPFHETLDSLETADVGHPIKNGTCEPKSNSI